MIIKQTFCSECDKVVDDLPIIDGHCPRCDIPNFKIIVKEYQVDNFSNMDMYYTSCSPPKQTVGSIADKNTKKFGKNFIEEAETIKKINRDKKIDQMFAEKGWKRVKTSGKTPWYRDGKSMITEAEAVKFMKENDVKVKPVKVKKGKK